MTIQRKTNGYDKFVSAELYKRLEQWEKAVEKTFGQAVDSVEEFFYGERLVMADVRLENGNYAHMNVTANRISLTGYTCSTEEKELFGSLTLHDDCFKGGMIM